MPCPGEGLGLPCISCPRLVGVLYLLGVCLVGEKSALGGFLALAGDVSPSCSTQASHGVLCDLCTPDLMLSWKRCGSPAAPAGYHYEAVHVAARSHASGSLYRCWCEEDAGN